MRIICTVKLNNYDFIFMASMFLETKTNKDIGENYRKINGNSNSIFVLGMHSEVYHVVLSTTFTIINAYGLYDKHTPLWDILRSIFQEHKHNSRR